MADRPLGVTIIAILQLLGSIAGLALGALMVMGGMLIPIFGIIIVAIGAFMIIWAIIGILLFWGLWGLKGWAWMITMIWNIIQLILNVYNFWNTSFVDYTYLINIIIPLIIVIYLFFVRDAFR